MISPGKLPPLMAVLCVLVSGVVLMLTRPSVAPADAAGQRVVLAEVGSFSVGPRWTRTSDDAVLYYADPTGRPVVGLAGAVVADAGYCAGLPTSQRGFAGLTDVRPGDDVAAVTRAIATAWAAGVAGRDPPAVAGRAIRLGEGGAAVRVSLRLRTPATGDPCLARRVSLDVVGFAVEGPRGPGVAALVVVRDVDPDGVSEREVEEVVQSLRRRT